MLYYTLCTVLHDHLERGGFVYSMVSYLFICSLCVVGPLQTVLVVLTVQQDE